jgi:hypothetical protein
MLNDCSLKGRYTTKNWDYYHQVLATNNSVAKFSNRFATNYIYIIFLILTTGLAKENPLLKAS